MEDYSEAFIGLDTSKLRNAVAIADAGRVARFGSMGDREHTGRNGQAHSQLSTKYQRLTFCYEQGRPATGCSDRSRSLASRAWWWRLR